MSKKATEKMQLENGKFFIIPRYRYFIPGSCVKKMVIEYRYLAEKSYHRFLSLQSQNINPVFVKMDKDRGQIWAAQKVWPKATINLCLWHVLRAIKKRISDPKEQKILDLSR